MPQLEHDLRLREGVGNYLDSYLWRFEELPQEENMDGAREALLAEAWGLS